MGTRVLEWGRLPELFPTLPRGEHWLPILQAHAALVAGAAPLVRLTAVEPEDAVRRHYAESLEIARILLERADYGVEPADRTPFPSRLVDVGSGGGFPGLVLAAVFRETEIHLVEPLQKRARLLVEFAEALELANVVVHPQRAELAGRGPLRDSADVVTARAVAEMRELLEYTAPFCRPQGLIVLPKGSSLSEEIDGAAAATLALNCVEIARVAFRPEVSDRIGCVVYRKSAATPAGYPRRPGMPSKRPL